MAGTKYRLITDHLGSVRLVVNPGGGVAERLDYDECGNVIQDSAPGWQPFGYAGGFRDVATSLIRFGFRDYVPETGHWSAKDPVLFKGGTSYVYEYCNSDPVNCIDPSGLWTTGVHDQLTVEAVIGRGASQYEMSLLKDAQYWADWGPGAQDDQSHHALNQPGLENTDAWWRYVQDQLDEAVCWEKKGKHELAMRALGFGMHALQDYFSPEHGFQVWDGSFAGAVSHVGKETFDGWFDTDGRAAAVNASTSYWNQFKARTAP